MDVHNRPSGGQTLQRDRDRGKYVVRSRVSRSQFIRESQTKTSGLSGRYQFGWIGVGARRGRDASAHASPSERAAHNPCSAFGSAVPSDRAFLHDDFHSRTLPQHRSMTPIPRRGANHSFELWHGSKHELAAWPRQSILFGCSSRFSGIILRHGIASSAVFRRRG